MAVFQLEKMSWEDVEQLDKARTVLFLPVSPIEEHGPHLPLGTDIFCARDIAAEAAGIITRQDPRIQVVLAPAIPIGCAPTTADFPGTLSVQADTLKKVIADVCSALVASGFKYILISNHHMDPVHMKAILSAIDELNASLDVRIVETCSQRFRHHTAPVQRFLEQAPGLDLRHEIHADVKETSYILHRHKELCHGDYRRLPDQKIDLRESFRKGMKTFRQMGADSGYIGSPRHASAEFGRIYLEDFSRSVAQMAFRLFEDVRRSDIGPER